MRAYTRLLGSGSVGTINSQILLCQAPLGYQTVLRDFVLVHRTGPAGSFVLFRTPPAEQRYLWAGHLEIASVVHLELRQVLPAGSLLYLYVTSIELADASLTGYELVDD